MLSRDFTYEGTSNHQRIKSNHFEKNYDKYLQILRPSAIGANRAILTFYNMLKKVLKKSGNNDFIFFQSEEPSKKVF